MDSTPKTWFDAIAAISFAGICAAMVGILNRVGDVSHVIVRLETQVTEMKVQLAKAEGYESRISTLETKVSILQEKEAEKD